jgi:WhiB family redox-sensing transcriptional regulator
MSAFTELLLPGHWANHAACRDLDPKLFTPDETETEDANRLEDGVTICKEICLVQSACLTHALEHGEPVGVWGGRRATERMPSRRARNRGRKG